MSAAVGSWHRQRAGDDLRRLPRRSIPWRHRRALILRHARGQTLAQLGGPAIS